MNNKAIIVGAFNEIIELAEETGVHVVGLIDNEKKDTYHNYQVLSDDLNAANLSSSHKKVPLIITPDSPKTRAKLFNFYRQLGFSFISLISNNAKISNSAKIGIGIIIQDGVNVSSDVTINGFVKLNSLCNIMHNAIIGDFTTVAPNAVVLGYVKIGKYCYIGANATILQNISIGDNVIIGAGAVITKNVGSNKIMIGNPARELNK